MAVGCLAERYGKDLAESLPEADAVLGFDDYPDIAAKLRAIVGGEAHHPHTPSDRRRLLPISPVDRDASTVSIPGHRTRSPQTRPTSGQVRRRRAPAPYAVASTPARWPRSSWRAAATGAAPSARSRPSAAPSSAGARATCSQEARWLATQGVKELFLVSENSTSYGKDLGDLRLLETLLPELSGDRRDRAGAGVLPPARRDPSRPDRGHRRHPGRRALLRPVLPARECHGAAPDAPLR